MQRPPKEAIRFRQATAQLDQKTTHRATNHDVLDFVPWDERSSTGTLAPTGYVWQEIDHAGVPPPSLALADGHEADAFFTAHRSRRGD